MVKDAAYYREYRARKVAEEVAVADGKVAKELKLRPKSATIKLAEKLIDPKWRGLMEYLATNLRHDCADDVRIGCYGPTISEIKPLLASVP